MNESFLHYIWQFQYFSKSDLETPGEEAISIFYPGHYNTHAGPDFTNARIRIGELEWRGNVEIHIRSSDWNVHKHGADPAYDNVILHVVWHDDEPVFRKDGTVIPTLVLKGRIDDTILLNYRKLVTNPESIPCSGSLAEIEDVVKTNTLDNALMNRLEGRAQLVNDLLKRNSGDWEETTYQLICRHMGFKTNSEPMETLSKAMPYRVLLKHTDRLVQIEAMLFGQSGLLNLVDPEDAYSKLLGREFKLLSHKYQLERKQMNKAHWKFLRLRPANFPTIRIAQLASLVASNKSLFSNTLQLETISEIREFFSLTQSYYWCEHYQFGKTSSKLRSGLGTQSVNSLIINVVVPILVAYGNAFQEQHYVDRAIQFLEHIPGELNSITTRWKNLGFRLSAASDSQALIELYNNSCQRRRCLACGIGASIVKP